MLHGLALNTAMVFACQRGCLQSLYPFLVTGLQHLLIWCMWGPGRREREKHVLCQTKGRKNEKDGHGLWWEGIMKQAESERKRRRLTKEGSSGSGVRGEPSGVEGQLWSLALVTSPSARASNEGNPSSSTGILSRVSVSTASKLASFSSSIFLESGKGKGREKEQRGKK